jgi:hypothetical protein
MVPWSSHNARGTWAWPLSRIRRWRSTINKTKAENAKAGFGSAAQSSASPAATQQVSRVQFPPGKDHVTVNGAVRGDEYHDYVLRARAGQALSAHLTIQDTNGDGTIYFNVLPPGSDGEAIFNGSTSADGSGRVANGFGVSSGRWPSRPAPAAPACPADQRDNLIAFETLAMLGPIQARERAPILARAAERRQLLIAEWRKYHP